jgi:hypothetical protein
MSNYQGWKNRATWNVGMWISNDEGLYNAAVSYVRSTRRPTYRQFVEYAGLSGARTPDGFKYDSQHLGYAELSRMLRELAQ